MKKLYDLVNIKGQDLESVIKDVRKKVSFALPDLDKSQTCLIYSSYVYYYLTDQNVLCYFVNTNEDYDTDYEHYFVYVPYDENNRYVIDLTYSQFGEDEKFSDMYKNGYMLLSKEKYQDYLHKIASIKSRR